MFKRLLIIACMVVVLGFLFWKQQEKQMAEEARDHAINNANIANIEKARAELLYEVATTRHDLEEANKHIAELKEKIDSLEQKINK